MVFLLNDPTPFEESRWVQTDRGPLLVCQLKQYGAMKIQAVTSQCEVRIYQGGSVEKFPLVITARDVTTLGDESPQWEVQLLEFGRVTHLVVPGSMMICCYPVDWTLPPPEEHHEGSQFPTLEELGWGN